MFTVHITDSGKLAVVTLRGSLTASLSRSLNAHLLRMLRCFNRIIVNAEQVTGMDASLLEQLCRAHRSAAALQKDLVLVGFRFGLAGQSTNEAPSLRIAAAGGTEPGAGEKPSGSADNPISA